MTNTPAKRPASRPSTARVHTRKTEENADQLLEQGFSFVDSDGTELSVRFGDIKGVHEAKLVAATGMDFMQLFEALHRRQGLDLFAAVIWFTRLVNDRPGVGEYSDVLETLGYGDLVGMEMDVVGAGDKDPDAPEA